MASGNRCGGIKLFNCVATWHATEFNAMSIFPGSCAISFHRFCTDQLYIKPKGIAAPHFTIYT